MGKIDQFESTFRAAIRDVYQYKKIDFKSILVVTDLDEQDNEQYIQHIRQFSQLLHIADQGTWQTLNKNDFFTTSELLKHVEQIQPDLIFTYRNLHSKAWKYPHSLGEHLDVLIQKTESPVFILPHPQAGYAQDYVMKDCDSVMALTDQMANDHKLINYAISFTQDKGTLYLTHIEDIDTFERYIDAISKIPSINTDDARDKLRKELLKQPGTYINTVIERLQQEKINITIKPEVSFGRHLNTFRKCIDAYQIDLLVLNAKDQQQMAMHGLAYPLAIELRQIPLLMV